MSHRRPCSIVPTNGRYPRLATLALLLAVTTASGSSCPTRVPSFAAPPPRVLPVTPTLADVMAVVNANSQRVQTLYTTQASISVPGAPTMRAEIALERPRRLRLRATVFQSTALDLGSNDEIFWFWIHGYKPPGVYVCRHDQFYTSAARGILPVPPQWLIEAIGLTELDPAVAHRGPIPSGQGRLRIESPLDTPEGTMTKVMLVDESQGWVVAQHLYDARGQLVASALASQHGRDPATGATLPGRVEIHWPAARFSLRIDLRNLVVNRLPAESQNLWVVPQFSGQPTVDLADPNLQFGREPPTQQETQPQARRQRSDEWRGSPIRR